MDFLSKILLRWKESDLGTGGRSGGEELENDDDDDELKMMTHAFTKCRDKCALARSPSPVRMESFHAQIGHANCAFKGRGGEAEGVR